MGWCVEAQERGAPEEEVDAGPVGSAPLLQCCLTWDWGARDCWCLLSSMGETLGGADC